jgi:hypothetical protein
MRRPPSFQSPRWRGDARRVLQTVTMTLRSVGFAPPRYHQYRPEVPPPGRDRQCQLYDPYRPDGNQRLLRYGPNVLGDNPNALFKWASSRMCHNLLIVSRCDSDRSKSTRSTARNANVVSASPLRSKADRIEGQPMTSRNRKTVVASVRLCFGGNFWDSKTCATLRASTIIRSELMREQR